mmetsp:Transcript_22401/g.46582  ORF Transcript_22401/g.46582 Transcript_22401/m.46582 type:complete len:549 (+) Transcript_22401:136-1782(+)|eukprot:CAMPEP_0118651236 /NCGR_PEP_ID=MMETSP0785-20121206/10681_1 /TAXON_ID=91992 /ORGANISM="Bolidomonas pacifica, Strain CCMP 1866" /LENGTH=548 /DNA_ID=CAMNT_0006543681 /DNA_START=107 /DNA_END=1753 /DNA_ORIENTATION=+
MEAKDSGVKWGNGDEVDERSPRGGIGEELEYKPQSPRDLRDDAVEEKDARLEDGVGLGLIKKKESRVQSDGSGTRRKFTAYQVLGSRFDVESRYQIIDVIGRGAYGVVCAARDDETNGNVAIKKISDIFEHITFTKRTLREIRLLRLLKHENLIGLRSVMRPLDAHSFSDLYIISDLMETDLSSVIKSPQHLSNDHQQFFVYQICRGMKYLHTCNVVHRDMKPRNLLVNSNCDVKICDFGLARIDFPEMSWKTSIMTDYVATRWYRAPEIIVGWGNYTKAVDIWSIGCILAELILRKPLLAGSNNESQLRLICDLIGSPSDEAIQQVKKPRMQNFLLEYMEEEKSEFGEGVDSYMRMMDFFAPYSPNPLAVDILHKILRFNPDERPDIEELLRHPYFANLHCEEDEPSGYSIPAEEFAFEEGECDAETLRNEVIEEILIYSNEMLGDVQDTEVEYNAEEKLDEEDERSLDFEAKSMEGRPEFLAEVPEEEVDAIRSTIRHAARRYGGADNIEEEEKEEIASKHVLTVDQIDEIIEWIYFRAKWTQGSD